MPSSSSAPLSSVPLSPEVREDLEYQLERRISSICKLYAKFVSYVSKSLSDKGVSPDDLRSFLLNLPAFDHDTKQGVTLLSDVKNELKKEDSINDIIDFLSSRYASFLNYEVFESIVERFDADVRDILENYKEHLQIYIKNLKLSEFIQINPALVKMSEYMKDKMILKVDMKLLAKLSKLCELKRPLAKILGVNPSIIYLCGVEEGCVVVTYLIPVAVTDVIFSKGKEFTMEEKREFRDLSVQWLKCHDHTFRFEQEVSVHHDFVFITSGVHFCKTTTFFLHK